LRTLPPRENGGNFDVKQLTRGAKLLLPVFVEGALFSTGDAHFAQGDGEVCVTAVEMGATAAVRFKIHKGLAMKRTFAGPVFSHSGYFADPRNLQCRKISSASWACRSTRAARSKARI
jgi:formamidase